MDQPGMTSVAQGGLLLDIDIDLSQHLDELDLDESDDDDEPVLRWKDGRLVDTWRESYPYAERMPRPDYEVVKRQLQIELLKLQNWVKDTGQRIVILFEGRDAAGKGGTIKRFAEHLNPRGATAVALESPSDRERGEWYFQRYVQRLPSTGEVVLFDRSWYNRAGVERVMGFCTDHQYEVFLQQAPVFEQMLTGDGIHLVKLWFSVSRSEQRTRFLIRRIDPVRQWKLSPTDLASLTGGTTTPWPRKPCSSRPTPLLPRGRWSRATTKSGPGSAPCATCSASSTIPVGTMQSSVCLTRWWSGRRLRYTSTGRHPGRSESGPIDGCSLHTQHRGHVMVANFGPVRLICGQSESGDGGCYVVSRHGKIARSGRPGGLGEALPRLDLHAEGRDALFERPASRPGQISERLAPAGPGHESASPGPVTSTPSPAVRRSGDRRLSVASRQ